MLELVEAAVHLEPTGSEAHYYLARIYQKLNEPVKANEEMEVAKNLLSSKLQREESVLSVTGARGDATQQLGLSPQRDTAPAANVSH